MKKIKYSVRSNTVVWGAKAGQKRYTAVLQTSGLVSLSDFAEHMSAHDSKYNKGDLMAVITQMAGCVREFLTQGYSVELGDLGTLSPRITQTAAHSQETYTPANIKVLGAGFKPGRSLTGMIAGARFEYVSTLKEQAALNAATKAGHDTVKLTATLTLASAAEAQGTVIPSGTMNKPVGTTLMARAEPRSGYEFDKWSDGDTNPLRRITLKADTTLTATFKATPSSSGDTGGSTGGSGDTGGGTGVTPYE